MDEDSKWVLGHRWTIHDDGDKEEGETMTFDYVDGICELFDRNWGSEAEYFHSSRGVVEHTLTLDEDNTRKLMALLKAKDGRSLVERMSIRFGRYGLMTKYEMCKFWDAHGIAYSSDVYYA